MAPPSRKARSRQMGSCACAGERRRPLQSFERKSQVRAALVPGKRMQFVHDDELAVAQMSGIAFLCEHHRETFRSGDEKMRRALPELDAFRRRRIASPQVETQFFLQPHSNNGRAQIFPDVVSQRAERRHVDALHGRRQRPVIELSQEKIEDAEKSRQGLAAARGRCEQNRLPIKNGGHAEQLRLGEVPKSSVKPLRQPRMQALRKLCGSSGNLPFHSTMCWNPARSSCLVALLSAVAHERLFRFDSNRVSPDARGIL